MPWVDGTSWVVPGILGYLVSWDQVALGGMVHLGLSLGYLVSWDQGAQGGWYIPGCPWYPGILSIMGSGCLGWMVHPGLSLVSWDT